MGAKDVPRRPRCLPIVVALGCAVLPSHAEAQASLPASDPAARPSDPRLVALVEACRAAAWSEATKLGAVAIAAVLAGSATSDRAGRTTAPVRIRIAYPGFVTWDMKEAIVTCTIDKAGRIVSGP